MKNFKIAVMPGDGIGREIMTPTLEIIDMAIHGLDIVLSYDHIEAGAQYYAETGNAFPESHFERAEWADAILLGAMGDPNIRYPDGTEIGPQHDLRKRLGLYAGVRPCKTIPSLPLPLIDERTKNLDFVIVRESTEGLFAFPRGFTTDDDEYKHNLMRISKTVSKKLFNFSFNLARRRHQQGRGKNLVSHIDKANVLSSQHHAREWFYEVAKDHKDVNASHKYVDFAALDMVRRPWEFDVMPTENQYGDILSDLAAALMGGMGMAPSGEIGDNHALFQPCHGSAPDIAGMGKANPTGMILSAAMMLDYLSDKHNCPEAAIAGKRIEDAVLEAYEKEKLLPYELNGTSGLNEISNAIKKQIIL